MKSVALLYWIVLLVLLMKETEGFTGPIPGKRSVKAKVCFVGNQVVENDVFGFAFQNLSLLGSGGRAYSNS